MTLVSSPVGGPVLSDRAFNYPQALMAKVRAREAADEGNSDDGRAGESDSGPISVAPDKLNFDYTVSGSAPFRPEVVFDDGKSVWLRLPVRAPFAVPIVDDHGDKISPNFIRRGPYIVVQQMADEIVLRAAHDEVTITRNRHGLFGF